MHHHYPHGVGPHHPGHPPHAGVADVIGGVVNLTTAALYGGARLVRTVVEGTMWYGCHPHHDPCVGFHPGSYHHRYHDCCSCWCSHLCHCCTLEHVPPLYSGCC